MKKKIAVLTTMWSFDYVSLILQGLRKGVEKDSVDIFLFTCYGYVGEKPYFNQGEYNIFNLIHYEDFDGVLILSNLLNSVDVLKHEVERIKRTDTPAISMEFVINGIDYIGSDNYSGMFEIVEHLITKHNCRRIAYIGGPDDNYESQERKKAFLDVMKKCNIDIDPKIFFDHGDWSYDFALFSVEKLIKTGNKIPDAIVCVNDEGALASLTFLLQNGYRVPEEIKIVGFDNAELGQLFSPTLSTVGRDWEEMGFQAAQSLLDKIKDKKTNAHTHFPTKAYYHRSCGCIEEKKVTPLNYSMNSFYNHHISLEFSRQTRNLENFFLENDTITDLYTQMQSFFLSNHSFEGADFAIALEKNLIPSVYTFEETKKRTEGYGDSMRLVVNIHDNKPGFCGTLETRSLIPEDMKTDENNYYVFLPLHYQANVQGFLIQKNNFDLLKNRLAYDWTKGFSNGLEKFSQKYMYILLNKRLTDISMRDSMTGLLNRFGYKSLAYDMFKENKRLQLSTVIVFFDINSMKTINDTYGHLHGDLAIKTVAEVIQELVPEKWLPIRFGGDEYLIIGSNGNNEETESFCASIKERIAERIKRMTLPYSVTISSGYSIVPADCTTTLDEEVTKADEAMYAEKVTFHKTINDSR